MRRTYVDRIAQCYEEKELEETFKEERTEEQTSRSISEMDY